MKKQNQNGFSIIEALAGVAIFSIVLFAYLQASSSQIKQLNIISEKNSLEDIRYFIRKNLSCNNTLAKLPGGVCNGNLPIAGYDIADHRIIPVGGTGRMGDFQSIKLECDPLNPKYGIIPFYKKINATNWVPVFERSNNTPIICPPPPVGVPVGPPPVFTNEVFAAFEDSNYPGDFDSMDFGVCIKGAFSVVERDFQATADGIIDFVSVRLGEPAQQHSITISIEGVGRPPELQTFDDSRQHSRPMPVKTGDKIKIRMDTSYRGRFILTRDQYSPCPYSTILPKCYKSVFQNPSAGFKCRNKV